MRALLLIFVLTQAPDWKLIKEMSGEVPNHPGITVNFYAAEIARSDNQIRLLMKAEFPDGAPQIEGATYPRGFDTTSISRMEGKLKFNCDTLIVKFINGSAEIYQFNGKKLKSKELPFALNSGHILFQYFCERGERPKTAPILKPK